MDKKNDYGVSIKMLIVMFLSIASLLMPATRASYAENQWNIGVSGGQNGIDGFHVSVGEYYKAPEREVVVIQERGIDEEELPVVYFLARRARVQPGAIVDLRLRGMSWMNITLHYGLNPDIYYVPVTVVEVHDRHHSHGHSYGYYKKHKHKDNWRKLRLRDEEIVDQVNLRFISDHYKYKPEDVIRYRSEGRRFTAIDSDIRQERHGKIDGGDRHYDSNGRHTSPDRHERQIESHGHGKGKKQH